MKTYQRISEKSTSLQEIPNLLPVTKVTPTVNKENIRVTQVHGSMEGKKILEKVSVIKEDKAKKEQAQKERKYKQQQQIEPFSLNVRKNAHVARMFVLQPSFKNAHVAIMFENLHAVKYHAEVKQVQNQ